jgi:hydrogenase maturation protease
MDEFLKSASCSVHEVGMRDLLDAARLTATLPARRALVGVQPDRVAWGEKLSPPVAAAVPAAVALARGILERWQRDVVP